MHVVLRLAMCSVLVVRVRVCMASAGLGGPLFPSRVSRLALRADGPVALGLAFSVPYLGARGLCEVVVHRRHVARAPSARACSRSCVDVFVPGVFPLGQARSPVVFPCLLSSIPARVLVARRGVLCRFLPRHGEVVVLPVGRLGSSVVSCSPLASLSGLLCVLVTDAYMY